MTVVSSLICRLCVKNCEDFKNLYSLNGRNTKYHELALEYFHPKIVDMEKAKHLTVICQKCWGQILDFNSFQASIELAQLSLMELFNTTTEDCAAGRPRRTEPEQLQQHNDLEKDQLQIKQELEDSTCSSSTKETERITSEEGFHDPLEIKQVLTLNQQHQQQVDEIQDETCNLRGQKTYSSNTKVTDSVRTEEGFHEPFVIKQELPVDQRQMDDIQDKPSNLRGQESYSSNTKETDSVTTEEGFHEPFVIKQELPVDQQQVDDIEDKACNLDGQAIYSVTTEEGFHEPFVLKQKLSLDQQKVDDKACNLNAQETESISTEEGFYDQIDIKENIMISQIIEAYDIHNNPCNLSGEETEEGFVDVNDNGQQVDSVKDKLNKLRGEETAILEPKEDIQEQYFIAQKHEVFDIDDKPCNLSDEETEDDADNVGNKTTNATHAQTTHQALTVPTFKIVNIATMAGNAKEFRVLPATESRLAIENTATTNNCPKRFRCDQCDCSYSVESSLRYHIGMQHPPERTANRNKAFTKTISSVNKLKRKISHRDTTTSSEDEAPVMLPNKRFKCKRKRRTEIPDKLGKDSTDCYTETARVANQKLQKSFGCKLCSRTFTKTFRLQCHINLSHKGKFSKEALLNLSQETSAFKCKLCGCCYSNYGNLKRHIKFHHPETMLPEQQKKNTSDENTEDEVSNVESSSFNKASSKRFTCHFCDQSYAAKENFHLHMEKHLAQLNRSLGKQETCNESLAEALNNIRVQCPICDLSCDKRHLARHMGRKHAKAFKAHKAELSKICDNEANEKSKSPTSTKANKAESLCKICHKAFGSEMALKVHHTIMHKAALSKKCDNEASAKSQSPTTPKKTEILCKVCKKAFVSEMALKIHYTVIHARFQNTCKICKKVFATERALKIHSTAMHKEKLQSSPKALQHESMLEAQTTKDNALQQKQQNNSPTQKLCGTEKVLKNQDLKALFEAQINKAKALKDHNSPTNNKPSQKVGIAEQALRIESFKNKRLAYTCKICTKSYNAVKSFRRHYSMVHAPIRPIKIDGLTYYKCGECEQKFEKKGSLYSHRYQSHIMQHKYKCNICNEKFATAAHMRVHSLKHKQKFTCKYCAQNFKHYCDLCRHQKKKHPLERVQSTKLREL